MIVFFAFNAATLLVAVLASVGAWSWLSLPVPPLAQLFIATGWGGLLLVSVLWFLKATFTDDDTKP